MKRIRLDATIWSSPADFYDALLPELDAPEWHGRNLDALLDSLRGGVNRLEPPLSIEVSGARTPEMDAFLAGVREVFDDAREEGVAVRFRVV